MTPEIEKATQDWITAEREYNEAKQGFKEMEDALANGNPDYIQTQQKLEKLNKQYKELKTKENNLEARIGIEERKARKISEALESDWGYQHSRNGLINARDKLDCTRNYLERLIAKEAENDTANSNRA